MCEDDGVATRKQFFEQNDSMAVHTRDVMEQAFPDNRHEPTGTMMLNPKGVMLAEAMEAPMAKEIDALCKELAFFLKIKNARYGNSALEPVQVFSNASPDDQMNNRMDDKLKRIKNSDEHHMNDFVDLAGYIVLKCLNKGWTNFDELLD